MYAIFFYFSNEDLQKILYFLDELNKWFEKYFWIKYDWLAWTDTEKFLKYRDWDEKNRNYWVWTINNNWPHNMVKYWDDSFYISTEVSELRLPKSLQNNDDFLEELQKKFCEEMFEKLPLLWAVSCFEEYEKHISKIDLEENVKYTAFVYKKENWKLLFFEWNDGVDWFKRKS